MVDGVVVPLGLATGGGSGGGLVRGNGLGSEGDSRGVDEVDVLGLVRDVSGNPSADLVKGKEEVLELTVSPSILP